MVGYWVRCTALLACFSILSAGNLADAFLSPERGGIGTTLDVGIDSNSKSESFLSGTKTWPLFISAGSSGFPSGPLSGNLISQIAVLAIQVCLASYRDVSCDVASLPQDLFQGKIGPVTVKGKGWKSSRGLSCRAIEARVDTCKLDMARVLTDRTLVLTNPAEGKAMVAMTAEDFGNFLIHPRLEQAKLKVSRSAGLLAGAAATGGSLGRPESSFSSYSYSSYSQPPSGIDFSKDGVVINAVNGSVSFRASCLGSRCQCVLQRASENGRNGRKAIVQVTTLEEDDGNNNNSVETAERLTKVFTDFFNEMVFELYNGLFLSFRDLRVTDNGDSPSVLLSLNIRVEKFPWPTAIRPSSF